MTPTQFAPGKTVGIDLGTTFSALSYLNDEGEPVPVANADDDVETPSLILLADSGHVIVGPNRMRAAMEDPNNVVERVKRQMGNADYARMFDGHEITPEFVSALILKKLRIDAEQRIGKIGNAVVTVPYYFNDARRKATQDAGRIAGLNVIDIINEPTAATLTYAWQQEELGAFSKEVDRPRLVLVYDLGGGTFDATVVRFTPTHFRVLATDGDVHLGGVDWNERLVDHVAAEFKDRHESDPRQSTATLQVLRTDCDQAKIALSTDAEASVSCRHEGRAVSVSVTRSQFEELTADLLQRTIDTTEQVLEAADVKSGDLDAIVMVGGSTLMPRVAEAMEQVTGKKPFQGLSPHISVAQGAAIHAAILDAKHRGSDSELADRIRKHLRTVEQEDVNSHGLGVAARNPKSGKTVNHVMIPRNTPLPAEVRQTFKTNTDGQQRVSVRVIEGDAPDPAACSLIGLCRITDLQKGLPKGSPIEVAYAFDESGRVTVRAIDKTGGQEARIEIERRGGLDEQQINAYLRLAEQYKVE